jgi:hypothetical protein
MIQHRNTSTNQYYTMRLLTLAVLPVAIYLLQQIGKVYGLASIFAGILIFVKILIDLMTALPVSPSAARQTAPSPRRRIHQSPPCQLCGNANKILVPHSFDSRHLWVCHDCHSCMKFTEQYA